MYFSNKQVNPKTISILRENITKTNKKIIVYIKENACESCLNTLLKNISIFEKEDESILLCGKYSNPNKFKLLLLEHKIKSSFVILKEDDQLFSETFDFIDLVLFTIDEFHIIDNVFFPIQTEEDLLLNYFENVKKQ